MSNIRVTYTGLLSFTIALLSVIFGIIFSLVLTRELSIEEYGTWGLISILLFYVSMLAPVVTFWITREITRNIESGKTAVLGSTFLSCGAIGIFILISYFMSSQTGTDQNIFILAAILIPAIFLNGVFTAINLGWKPHTISYGTLSFGLSQVIFVILFVLYFDFGIMGAIFANLLSYVVSNTILFKIAYKKLKNNLNKNFIKKWFNLSWLPLYPSLSILIDSLGIVIFTIITGSVIGLAFWTIAVVIASIISHSELISRAVYPKLLEGGSKNYLQTNISQLFYFSLLMTGFVIIFAKPTLFAMNPIYESAVWIVIIMALTNFFRVITNVSILNLSGMETVDIDKNASFKKYLRSQLFYPYSVRLIQTTISIIALTIGLILLIDYDVSNNNLLIFWALVYFFSQIPISLHLFNLMCKKSEIGLDQKIVLKYLLITIFSFGLTFVITEQFLEYDEEIFTFVPNLLFFVIIGIFIHIVISYFTASEIRLLIHDIVKEIRNKPSKP
jgi:hypothetical protein